MTSVPFSMRIDQKVKTLLRREAKQSNRSESYIASTAIKQYLAAREHKRNAIEEALSQADKGAFISSKKMGAWVDSWGSDDELDLPKNDVKIKK